MWERLIFGIILAATAYYVINYFSTDGFTHERYAQGPIIEEPTTRKNHQVSSSGPNPPASAPPHYIASEMSRPPEANDPYDRTNEDANAPEQLRFPERSFGPGVAATETINNENAGLAGPATDSSQAFQQFSPEFVTNGGSFFGSVTAVEDENPNYSAF
jgi:hypothetical protein